MESIIDATAFIGDYPFRGFSKSTPADYKKLTQKYGIDGAVISSFHEIFWENNLDAVRRTHDQIGGDSFFRHFPVVNPNHPGQLAELPQLLDEIKVSGIRLTPAYHQYHLWDSCAKSVLDLATEKGLIVQIFRTIQDERMHWMLSVPPVQNEEFERLLATPPSTPIILSGLQNLDIYRLSAKLGAAPNAYVDLSRVRGPVFAIEKLVGTVGAEKLIFGSLWPIQLVASTIRQIEEANISTTERSQILGSNLKSLLQS